MVNIETEMSIDIEEANIKSNNNPVKKLGREDNKKVVIPKL